MGRQPLDHYVNNHFCKKTYARNSHFPSILSSFQNYPCVYQGSFQPGDQLSCTYGNIVPAENKRKPIIIIDKPWKNILSMDKPIQQSLLLLHGYDFFHGKYQVALYGQDSTKNNFSNKTKSNDPTQSNGAYSMQILSTTPS